MLRVRVLPKAFGPLDNILGSEAPLPADFRVPGIQAGIKQIMFREGGYTHITEGIHEATPRRTISDEIVMTLGGPPGGLPPPGSV